MRNISVHSTEDDKIIGAVATVDLPAGTCIRYLEQIAFLTSDVKAGQKVSAVKRGVIKLSSKGIQIMPGFTGVIFANERAGSFGNFDVLDISAFGDIPVGIIQKWEVEEGIRMYFYISVGFAIGGSGTVDELARALANQAIDNAAAAQLTANNALGLINSHIGASFPGRLSGNATFNTLSPNNFVLDSNSEGFVLFDGGGLGASFDPNNREFTFLLSGMFLIQIEIRIGGVFDQSIIENTEFEFLGSQVSLLNDRVFARQKCVGTSYNTLFTSFPGMTGISKYKLRLINNNNSQVSYIVNMRMVPIAGFSNLGLGQP